MTHSSSNINNSIILFDGVCNLCSGTVRFIIKRDQKNKFRFASLQGNFGQSTLSKYGLSNTDLNSFLLLQDGILYSRSTGALKVARSLSGGWPLLYACIIIPKFVRDAVYDFIAANRYRWFGKNESCRLPAPKQESLFIE